MRRASIVLSAMIILVGCGGGPTAPTSSAPGTANAGPSQPAPPPSPAPDPNPAPGPTPGPAPSPNSDNWHWTATTTNAHWYGAAAVPGSFEVRSNRETLTFGSITTKVLIWGVTDTTLTVFARPNGMNVQITFDTATGEGSWTLTGVPGEAVGTLKAER